MIDLAMEKRHLAQANRDIASGEVRVAHQVQLVRTMREGGHGVSEAENLLETLQETLQTWCNHRENILAAIARMESAS